jgi:hypothetical protein
VTVYPERKLPGDLRGPAGYITGITLWAEGPDFIDTDKLPENEIAELRKCWPDEVTFKTEEVTKKGKDGEDIKTTENIRFVKVVWKEKLDEWLEANAGVLHLVKGVPVQPVKVENLSAEERDAIYLQRQEAAMRGEVVVSPPAQRVKTGMRTV